MFQAKPKKLTSSSYSARGIEAISPEIHGQLLQRLFRNLPATTTKKTAVKDLRDYLYLSCISNIQKRLLSKPFGFDRTFMSLFFSLETGEGLFTAADVTGDWPEPNEMPSELATADEQWLVEHVSRFSGFPPELQGNPRRLVPSPQTRWGLLQAFMRTLVWVLKYSETLHNLVDSDDVGPDNDTESNRILIRHTLRDLDRYMGLLWRMVHRSPTLYLITKMLTSRLQVQLVSENHQRSSTLTDGDGQGVPQSLALGQGTGRSVLESEDGDKEDADDESDEEEGDDEVEATLYTQDAPMSVFDLVRSWLWRVTRCSRTLDKLCHSAQQHGARTKFLEIGVRTTPEPADPCHQATLQETVQPLPTKSDFGERMNALRHLAEKNHNMKEKPNETVTDGHGAKKPKNYSGALGSLLGMTGKDGQPIEWEKCFTGSIHCEAYLATLIQRGLVGAFMFPIKFPGILFSWTSMAQVAKGRIGLSKCCCFCCAVYLVGSNVFHGIPPTQGKVAPWACPPDIPQDIKLAILEQLRAELVSCIEKYQEQAKSGDSVSAPSSLEPVGWFDEADPEASWEKMSKAPGPLMFSKPKPHLKRGSSMRSG